MYSFDDTAGEAEFASLRPQGRAPVVMQILPALETGGAEQGCIDVAQAIIAAGGTALVVSAGGPRVTDLLRKGATHITLPVASKNPVVMARNISKIVSLIKKHNVDLIHARSRAPAWSAYHAARKAGIPFMTTCHAPYNISGKAKRFYNSIMAKGARVIAISEFVATYLTENYDIDSDKIRIIHRGLALESFHPTSVTPERMIKLAEEWRVPDGAAVILMPARLTRWKGHTFVLEAMAELKRDDVLCVFVGSDQGRTGYRQELEKIVEEKKLDGKVRIVDHCNDMPAAYMLATVALSASTDPEGFGRVPIESQAMGRPVIGTDHGAVRETILRNRTGWLVPPKDSKALAQALEIAIDLNPHDRAVLGTRAMAHVAEHFTKEKMCAKTLDVYVELLKEAATVKAPKKKAA